MNTELALPRINAIYTHKENKDLYQVLMITNLCSKRPEAFPPTVVYMDAKMNVWSRPLTEFDEKMEPAPVQRQAAQQPALASL